MNVARENVSQQPYGTSDSAKLTPTAMAGFKCVEALGRIIIQRQEGHPACTNTLVWLFVWSKVHINSMTYTLFFIPDYPFQKVFLCFLR